MRPQIAGPGAGAEPGMPCTLCPHVGCQHSFLRKGVTPCPECDTGTGFSPYLFFALLALIGVRTFRPSQFVCISLVLHVRVIRCLSNSTSNQMPSCGCEVSLLVTLQRHSSRSRDYSQWFVQWCWTLSPAPSGAWTATSAAS